jgi:hypothetical protein
LAMKSTNKSARKERQGSSDEPSEELKKKALDKVREAYESAARMKGVNLDSVNRVRAESERFRSAEALLSYWFGLAAAVSRFAVSLKLITPEQSLQVILETRSAHPVLEDVLHKS